MGLQSLQFFELNQPFWVWPQSTLDVPPIMSICGRVHYHQADMVLGDVMIQNHGLCRPSLGRSKNLIVQAWNQHETANSMHINLSKLSFPAVSSVALLLLTNSGLFMKFLSTGRRNQENRCQSQEGKGKKEKGTCVSTLGKANKSPLFPATRGTAGTVRTVISNPQDPKHTRLASPSCKFAVYTVDPPGNVYLNSENDDQPVDFGCTIFSKPNRS